MSAPCTLSIIIPVLNDAPALRRCLESLAAERGTDATVEILVVDGGSEAACREAAREFGAEYLNASLGRALQMNAGTAIARGSWLWFLHADCVPAPGSLAALKNLDSAALWGCFRHRIDAPPFALRVIERADNFRARWLRLPYGDQGIFVRREAFESTGRFPAVPLLEDVLLAQTLGKLAAPRVLSPIMKTDARRWLQRGIFRTTWLNWKILWLFFVTKKSPEELARIYSGGDSQQLAQSA